MKEKELAALNKEMFYAMMSIAVLDRALEFILRLLGIDLSPDPLDGYEFFYSYCVDADLQIQELAIRS